MLTDLQQPAKHWLADAVMNFKTLLAEDDDPSFTLELNGCVIEIRLNEAPGVFSRRTITVSSDNAPVSDGGPLTHESKQDANPPFAAPLG